VLAGRAQTNGRTVEQETAAALAVSLASGQMIPIDGDSQSAS
jgi:hypothetical protein